ncbi:uncharacterized protein BKA55DRAFT_690535 [Fusarium redolens]|uniref:Uncharacterized protein n=1 Tax=Fusarium redolens TaxID=48865 RepID=A0A9P9K734_FUSRE|nr:uncharacterized protein BKA55DRAFT_690535 [Fusarium redolens]KAH7250303.1 hypothetical protein BKA55DRAFT_690535 [Fusarium redolens]
MKLTLAALTLLTLTAAPPPPEPDVLKPVPERAIQTQPIFLVANLNLQPQSNINVNPLAVSAQSPSQTTAVFLGLAPVEMAIATNSRMTLGKQP